MKRVSYIPPVTPDTLPADEILVRGSAVPRVTQSEVLLRAAKESETPKEDLLRLTIGGDAGSSRLVPVNPWRRLPKWSRTATMTMAARIGLWR